MIHFEAHDPLCKCPCSGKGGMGAGEYKQFRTCQCEECGPVAILDVACEADMAGLETLRKIVALHHVDCVRWNGKVADHSACPFCDMTIITRRYLRCTGEQSIEWDAEECDSCGSMMPPLPEWCRCGWQYSSPKYDLTGVVLWLDPDCSVLAQPDEDYCGTCTPNLAAARDAAERNGWEVVG